METVKAVIFDMDGVIFDSERVIFEIWKDMSERDHIKDMELIFMQCVGISEQAMRDLVMGFYGPDFPYDEYRSEQSRIYHERYDGGRLPMKPGVEHLLKAIKKRGLKCAVASSTRREVVVNQLRAAGLEKYFDVIVCGDMIEKSKPDPEIFLNTAIELDTPPSECMVIEDSYNGIRAAFTACMIPVMVPDLLLPDAEMRKKARFIEKDLFGVEKLLDARIIDREISLVPWYENEAETLEWYQDPDVCKQCDNIDFVYSIDRLRSMYSYLNENGRCYYIRRGDALVGDATLLDRHEICIVVAKPYQNQHIGRRVINNLVLLARSLNYPEVKAQIYDFNLQSRKCFEACGFVKCGPEAYVYHLHSPYPEEKKTWNPSGSTDT